MSINRPDNQNVIRIRLKILQFKSHNLNAHPICQMYVYSGLQAILGATGDLFRVYAAQG